MSIFNPARCAVVPPGRVFDLCPFVFIHGKENDGD